MRAGAAMADDDSDGAPEELAAGSKRRMPGARSVPSVLPNIISSSVLPLPCKHRPAQFASARAVFLQPMWEASA